MSAVFGTMLKMRLTSIPTMETTMIGKCRQSCSYCPGKHRREGCISGPWAHRNRFAKNIYNAETEAAKATAMPWRGPDCEHSEAHVDEDEGFAAEGEDLEELPAAGRSRPP